MGRIDSVSGAPYCGYDSPFPDEFRQDLPPTFIQNARNPVVEQQIPLHRNIEPMIRGQEMTPQEFGDKFREASTGIGIDVSRGVMERITFSNTHMKQLERLAERGVSQADDLLQELKISATKLKSSELIEFPLNGRVTDSVVDTMSVGKVITKAAGTVGQVVEIGTTAYTAVKTYQEETARGDTQHNGTLNVMVSGVGKMVVGAATAAGVAAVVTGAGLTAATLAPAAAIVAAGAVGCILVEKASPYVVEGINIAADKIAESASYAWDKLSRIGDWF